MIERLFLDLGAIVRAVRFPRRRRPERQRMALMEPVTLGSQTIPIQCKRSIAAVSYTHLSGYKGQVYPINPKADEILGLKCFGSVSDVPGDIDQVIVVIPAKAVASVLDEAGRKGVKGAIIITAGFRESGEEGLKHELELLQIANKYGMRIIGPNCLGIIDTWTPLNAVSYTHLDVYKRQVVAQGSSAQSRGWAEQRDSF